MKFLLDHDVVPIGYSPLGRVGSKSGPVGDDIREDELVKSLASKYSCTASQLLLAWGLSRGYSIIPKAQQAEHQEENFAALDIEIEADDIKQIREKFDERKMLYPSTFDVKYNVFA